MQGDTDGGQAHDSVGVVSGGGLHGGSADGDRLAQISLDTHPFEPVAQGDTKVGQVHGSVGVVGGDGLHGGSTDGDRLVQVSLDTRLSEPSVQNGAKDEQEHGPVRVVVSGQVHGPTACDNRFFEVLRTARPLEPRPQRAAKIAQALRSIGVVAEGGGHDPLPQQDRSRDQCHVCGLLRLFKPRQAGFGRALGEHWKQGLGQSFGSGDEARDKGAARRIEGVAVLDLRKRQVAVPVEPAEHVVGFDVTVGIAQDPCEALGIVKSSRLQRQCEVLRRRNSLQPCHDRWEKLIAHDAS